MKVNSEKLWSFINDLGTHEKVKFKVYYDDSYVTEILWNGENFEWESGRFTSEAFFNPLYDFIPIEEDKEIEEISLISMDSDFDRVKNIINLNNNLFRLTNKINELVREVNKLKKEGK